ISFHQGELLVLCIQKTNKWITGVVAAGCNYYFCYFAGGQQRIRYCSKDGETLWDCCVPHGLCVETAVFACSTEEGNECRLFALAYKHNCYPYLMECVPVDGAFCPALCCSCRPKPPCPEPKVCEDLLESVALMQTALSHILSTEGEKLQKVVSATDDVDTLLEVNQTVSRTLTDATFLEQVLYHKLELINDICSACKPEKVNPCDRCKPEQEDNCI
ncbi:MAG: hypothetical protein AB7C89_08310, partial [Intestinibacillus sp.]